MRTIQDMIAAEVRYCVSGIVSTLANGAYIQLANPASAYERDFTALAEQASELVAPVLDYESAAREIGWGPYQDEEGYLCFTRNGEVHYAADWDDLCRDNGIEPHEFEVCEHWAVTDWLGEKLEAAGEKVDHDFAGMTVWARTTTGQAIYADAVIERIYTDMLAA